MTRSPLMTTAASLVLAMGLVAAPAAASSQEEAGVPGETIVSIDCDAFAASPAAVESVDVTTGSSVVLSLCSNPTTGYQWSEPASSDPVVASVVGGWTYAAPESDLLGASGNERATIIANAPGSAVITAAYDQPWEGGAKGDWTVELTINVRDASTLLIGCDEFEAESTAVRSVDLAAGTSLVLSLCSNPTTGFRWSEPVSTDPAVASVSGWIYEAPVTEGAMAGAAGTEQVTITASAAGTAVVTASYDQPWDGGQKGAWGLELTVNVQ